MWMTQALSSLIFWPKTVTFYNVVWIILNTPVLNPNYSFSSPDIKKEKGEKNGIFQQKLPNKVFWHRYPGRQGRKALFLLCGKHGTNAQSSTNAPSFTKPLKKGNAEEVLFNTCPSDFYERGTEVMVFLAGYIPICLWNVCTAQSLYRWLIYTLGWIFV